MRIALMLGGGAPTLTLMSGALVALDEAGVRFDVVSTAGAGMLVGLLYAAPRGMSRREALRRTVEMGVSDAIYDRFPVNYKVFRKPGEAAQDYTRALQRMFRPGAGRDNPIAALMNARTDLWFPGLRANPQARALLEDWAGFWAATFCPSDLSPESRGLCQPAPWVEEVVDFAALRDFPGEFYINAYNLTDRKMEIFGRDEISVDHFHAALAFPFISAPFELNGKKYVEGSAIDTLNYQGLLEEKGANVDTIVVFDVLSRDELIREPRNLYDAWVRSIMVPLVAMGKDDTRIFELVHNRKHRKKLLRLPFRIPDDRWTTILDWSRSNLEALYDIGYGFGRAFLEAHRSDLLPRGSAGGEATSK
jgi:predicted acylesterase/phospholipase RssA